MEELFTNLILLTILIGGGKVLVFYILGKARNEMAASKYIEKGGNVVKLDHYRYIYGQDQIYNSMYPKVRNKFKDAMRSGVLTSEQIKFMERYLRDSLHDKGRYRNNAHCIYTLLQSAKLDNSHYAYLNQVLDDFILR